MPGSSTSDHSAAAPEPFVDLDFEYKSLTVQCHPKEALFTIGNGGQVAIYGKSSISIF